MSYLGISTQALHSLHNIAHQEALSSSYCVIHVKGKMKGLDLFLFFIFIFIFDFTFHNPDASTLSEMKLNLSTSVLDFQDSIALVKPEIVQ